MTFKIVSVGWNCATWWEQTLRSIEEQSVQDWEVWVTYDGGDDAGPKIQEWCDARDARWNCTLTNSQQFAVRNQVEAIQNLKPGTDDIIVFLDLDGDRFAHPHVLARLAEAYADGTLVTYGSFRPVPMVTTTTPATPFPLQVVTNNTYRKHTLRVGCCFNHLRTMSGRVFNSIPLDQFHWRDGRWYEGGTDYIFMLAALERAGGLYKYIPEVLLLYNHANPFADYLMRSVQSDAATRDFLSRPALEPLERLWSVD